LASRTFEMAMKDPGNLLRLYPRTSLRTLNKGASLRE
jgi:hypothetical protein